MDTKIQNQPSGSVAGQTLPNIIETISTEIHKWDTTLCENTKIWCTSVHDKKIYVSIAFKYGLTAMSLHVLYNRLIELGIRIFYIDAKGNRVKLNAQASVEQYTYDKYTLKDYAGDPFDETNAFWTGKD